MNKKIKITCKPVNAVAVTIDGRRRLYRSKKVARRKIAWDLLYDTKRMAIGMPEGSDVVEWMRNDVRNDLAHKRYECECNSEYGASDCQLHNNQNGYYKRLHARIVRWLEKGYIAPESGLMEVTE